MYVLTNRSTALITTMSAIGTGNSVWFDCRGCCTPARPCPAFTLSHCHRRDTRAQGPL
ncbi:hypothetical protein SAMN06272775_0787 [Streptomyces sp. 2323.1]|nr:hypothetical protein SAMN06272775_0787 [Streptomyces sp. 2323.1]